MKIKILTDSTSDIPKAVQERYNIEVVPLSVRFGDDEYIDGVTITNEQFFEKLAKVDKLPITSQVTVVTFMEKFTEMLKDDDPECHVIAVLIAHEFSGTIQSATIARDELKTNRIHIIDSRCSTFFISALVIEVAKMIEDGIEVHDIVRKSRELANRIRLRAVVDDLTYLHMGGRMSGAAKCLGTILKIKPVVLAYDGEIRLDHKSRGFKSGLNYIIDQLIEDADRDMPLYFGCGNVPDVLANFKAMVKERYDFVPTDDAFLGITVGTHVGPGAVGLVYFKK